MNTTFNDCTTVRSLETVNYVLLWNWTIVGWTKQVGGGKKLQKLYSCFSLDWLMNSDLCSVCSKRIFFKASYQQASSMINCLGFSKHIQHLIAPKEVIVHIKLVLTSLVSISILRILWQFLLYGFHCGHLCTRSSWIWLGWISSLYVLGFMSPSFGLWSFGFLFSDR